MEGSRRTTQADDMAGHLVQRAVGGCRAFWGHRVLDIEEAYLPAGAITAVTGPNGVGRSASAGLLTGLRRHEGDMFLGVLRAARPDDAVLGEEGGQRGAADAARQWLVDPLCGTLNYAVGGMLVAVNVALRGGAAAVADPFGGDLSGSVHFAAGIAVCRAAGCVVAADAETHGLLISMIRSRSETSRRVGDRSGQIRSGHRTDAMY
ncbi:inositol monophosphatase family protein [Streptosporangium saharense]|uniref:inositol monophosphatase family protein n=1 Tax=Streptosporangium saharense TaxID=1706840 RepID=UPI003323725C